MADQTYKIKIDTQGTDKISDGLDKAAASSKNLKQQLREMTNELQGLEPGSKRFNELSTAAGKLKDQIADTNSVIKATAGSSVENLSTAFSKTAGIGIAAFQGIGGAMAMFGGDAEQIQVLMGRLQGAMAMGQALKEFGALGDTFTDIKSAVVAAVSKMGLFTTATVTQAAATGAQTGATEVATIAQEGLNKSMLANPIFLIIAGVGALIAAFTLFSSKSEETEKAEKKRAEATKAAAKATKEGQEAIAKESGEFVGLIYQLKATNTNSKERSTLMKQINGTYGTTLQNLSDETAFQASLNEAVGDYIDLQYNKFKLQKNQKYIDQQLQKQFDAEQKMNAARKEAQEQVDSGLRRSIEDVFSYRGDLRELYTEGEKGQQEAIGQLEKLGARRGQLKGQQDDLTEGGKKYVAQQTVVNNVDKGSISINEELKASLEELTKSQYERTHSVEENLLKVKETKDEELKLKHSLSTDLVNRDQQLKDALLLNQSDYDDKIKKVNEDNNKKLQEDKEKYYNYLDSLEEDASVKRLQSLDKEIEQLDTFLLDKTITQEQYNEDVKNATQRAEEDITKIKKEEADKQAEIDKVANRKKIDDIISTTSELASIISGIRDTSSGFLNDIVSNTLSGVSKMVELTNTEFKTTAEKIGAYAQAIGGIISGFVSAAQEANQQRVEENIASIELNNQTEKNLITEQYNNGIISKTDYDGQVANLDKIAKDKTLEVKKKAFEDDKKYKIASATIAGITGAVAAFTGAMSLGPIAGPIVGGVLAAAVGVMTGLNIQKIKASKFDGGAVTPTGPGSGGSAGTSTSAAPTPPSLTINGQANAGSEGQGNQLYGLRQQVIKAVVLESDITNTQNTLSNYQTMSEIG